MLEQPNKIQSQEKLNLKTQPKNSLNFKFQPLPTTSMELSSVREKQKNLFTKLLMKYFYENYISTNQSEVVIAYQYDKYQKLAERIANLLLNRITSFEYMTREEMESLMTLIIGFKSELDSQNVAEACEQYNSYIQKTSVNAVENIQNEESDPKKIEKINRDKEMEYARILAGIIEKLGVPKGRLNTSNTQTKLNFADVYLPSKPVSFNPKTVEGNHHQELILPVDTEAELLKVENLTKAINLAEALFSSSLSTTSGIANALTSLGVNMAALYPMFINLLEGRAENKNVPKDVKLKRFKAMLFALVGTGMTAIVQPIIGAGSSTPYAEAGIKSEAKEMLAGKHGQTIAVAVEEATKRFESNDPTFVAYNKVFLNLIETRNKQDERSKSGNINEAQSAQGRLTSGYGDIASKAIARKNYESDKLKLNKALAQLRVARNSETPDKNKIQSLLDEFKLLFTSLSNNGQRGVGLNETVEYFSTIGSTLRENSTETLVKFGAESASTQPSMDEFMQNEALVSATLNGDTIRARKIMRLYNQVSNGENINPADGISYAFSASTVGVWDKISKGEFTDPTVLTLLGPVSMMLFLEIIQLSSRFILLNPNSKYSKLSTQEAQKVALEYADVLILVANVFAEFEATSDLQNPSGSSVDYKKIKDLLQEISRVYGSQVLLYSPLAKNIFDLIAAMDMNVQNDWLETEVIKIRQEQAQKTIVAELETQREDLNKKLDLDFQNLSYNLLSLTRLEKTGTIIEEVKNLLADYTSKYADILYLPQNNHIKLTLDLYNDFLTTFYSVFEFPDLLNQIPGTKKLIVSLLYPMIKFLRLNPQSDSYNQSCQEIRGYVLNFRPQPKDLPKIMEQYRQLLAQDNNKKIYTQNRHQTLEPVIAEINYQDTIVNSFNPMLDLFFQSSLVNTKSQTTPENIIQIQQRLTNSLTDLQTTLTGNQQSYTNYGNYTPFVRSARTIIASLRVFVVGLNLTESSGKQFLREVPIFITIFQEYLRLFSTKEEIPSLADYIKNSLVENSLEISAESIGRLLLSIENFEPVNTFNSKFINN